MELRRETTRFLRDAQYLPTEAGWGRGGQAGRAGGPGGGSNLVPILTPAGMPGNSKDLLCDFENTQ